MNGMHSASTVSGREKEQLNAACKLLDALLAQANIILVAFRRKNGLLLVGTQKLSNFVNRVSPARLQTAWSVGIVAISGQSAVEKIYFADWNSLVCLVLLAVKNDLVRVLRVEPVADIDLGGHKGSFNHRSQNGLHFEFFIGI